MSVWAIIKTGGKQYKISEGQTLVIEKLNSAKDAKITFDQVLALGGEKVSLGTPNVAGAKVSAKVLDNFKGKKVRVVKFKSKSRYTRTTGHRHQKTKVLIEKIQV